MLILSFCLFKVTIRSIEPVPSTLWLLVVVLLFGFVFNGADKTLRKVRSPASPEVIHLKKKKWDRIPASRRTQNVPSESDGHAGDGGEQTWSRGRARRRASMEGVRFLSSSAVIATWPLCFISATARTTGFVKTWSYRKERSAIYCWNCELPLAGIFLPVQQMSRTCLPWK